MFAFSVSKRVREEFGPPSRLYIYTHSHTYSSDSALLKNVPIAPPFSPLSTLFPPLEPSDPSPLGPLSVAFLTLRHILFSHVWVGCRKGRQRGGGNRLGRFYLGQRRKCLLGKRRRIETICRSQRTRKGGRKECVTCLIPSPECPSILAESLQPFFFDRRRLPNCSCFMHRLNFVLSPPPFSSSHQWFASVRPPFPFAPPRFFSLRDVHRLPPIVTIRSTESGGGGRKGVRPPFFRPFSTAVLQGEGGKRQEETLAECDSPPSAMAIPNPDIYNAPVHSASSPPHSIDASLWHHSRCVSTFRKRAIAPLCSLSPLSVSST